MFLQGPIAEPTAVQVGGLHAVRLVEQEQLLAPSAGTSSVSIRNTFGFNQEPFVLLGAWARPLSDSWTTLALKSTATAGKDAPSISCNNKQNV